MKDMISKNIGYKPSLFSNKNINSMINFRFYSDTGEKNFPKLPVLDTIYERSKKTFPEVNFKKTAFVCGQHLLNTTGSFFDWLIKMGADPKNIFVVGKSYSTNHTVMKQIADRGIYCQSISQQALLGELNDWYNVDIVEMWRKFEKSSNNAEKIIVLDDGGSVLNRIPLQVKARYKDKIMGIEQTSSGIAATMKILCPVIEVATSGVKKNLEPPMVAAKLVNKFWSKLEDINKQKPFFSGEEPLTLGIIGLGTIGIGILNELAKSGKYTKFILFDQNEEKLRKIEEEFNLRYQGEIVFVSVDNAGQVICSVDVVFGCVGRDIINGHLRAFNTIKNPLMLISCASKDTEFLSFLNYIQTFRRDSHDFMNPLEDIDFQNGFKAPIKILRGGTPFNFDNLEESVPAQDIQVIRGLKAVAIVQAYFMLEQGCPSGNYMLDPKLQKFVATQWLNLQPAERYSQEEKERFTSVDEIEKISGGNKSNTLRETHYLDKIKQFYLSSFPEISNEKNENQFKSFYKNFSNCLEVSKRFEPKFFGEQKYLVSLKSLAETKEDNVKHAIP